MADLIKSTDSLNEGRKKLNAIAKEMNEKDVISAPEIIEAKGEHNSLADAINSKADKGNVSVRDINKSLGKFDQTYMTDEFLQQMTDGSPINAVPADKSITTNKVADKAIEPELTTFAERGKNLWNGKYVVGKRLQNEEPFVWGGRENAVSVVFEGITGKTYTISAPQSQRDIFQVATFSNEPNNGDFAVRSLNAGVNTWETFTVTLTGSEKYIVVSISDENARPDWLQIEEGTEATDFSSPNNVKLKLDGGSVPYNALDQGSVIVTPEQTTFVKKGKNLWDGKFVYDVRMAGAPPSFVGADPGAVSVIFKGEKGKTYTISKSRDTDWGGVMTLDQEPLVGAPGTRQISGNGGSWGVKTVELQGNEQWILISLSSPTSGVEPEWLQIEEGASATSYVPHTAVKIDLDLSMLEIGEVSIPKLHVNKTGESMTVYVPSKHNTSKFIGHVYRNFTTSGSNTWLYDSAGIYERSGGVFLPTYMFSPGNSDNEGVLYIKGESDFVGGKHGFDIMEDLSVIVDGKEMDMSEDFALDCGFVRAVNKSRVNHDLSEDLPENKVFTRYKIHTWDLDGMTMVGKWIAEKTLELTSIKLCDFSVDQKVNGLTFPSWGRNNIDYIKHSLAGDFETTPRVENVSTQELWSDETNFYLALTCEYDRSKYPNHYTHIQQLGGTRAKIYFDFGAYTIQEGESIEYLNKYDFRV